MNIRQPIAAGQFYSGGSGSCKAEIEECLNLRRPEVELPGTISGGIVPHAGWVFSGDLAGLVFSTIKEKAGDVETFVIFGAVHHYGVSGPSVYDRGGWETPLGVVEVDEELAGKIADSGVVETDRAVHRGEHSIEVQVPFIKYMFDGAKIVPVACPPADASISAGIEAARAVKNIGRKAVFIASTDLTHYGPRYGFAPEGTGAKALKWAYEVNDKQFIDMALKLDSEGVIRSGSENMSACGAGAVAALIAAMKEMGKDKGYLLAHTTSNEVMEKRFGRGSEESVGYAAIIY